MKNIDIEEYRRNGSTYIQMSKSDYIKMLDYIEYLEDMDDIKQAKASFADGQEMIPLEVTKKIIAGENAVKTYREYRNMTQQKLADLSKVNRVYITEIENNKKPGSISAMKAIAAALGIDLDDLV
ncbi:MAG: helix-turn-helix transcriptional regulator [Pseudomonadota bacterium]